MNARDGHPPDRQPSALEEQATPTPRLVGPDAEVRAAALRITVNPELMEEWALVLESQGIANAIESRQGRLVLWAPADDQARAEQALALFDRERRELAEARVPAVPDQGPSAAGLAFALVIAAFHWVSGARQGSDLGGWFQRGSAIAERIMGGEPWRAVTALTLHADWAHVLGNATAALIFVTALGRWLGSGMALTLTLLTGTAGNLVVAAAYGSHHNSVGASTATFGALGLLGGLQVMRWLGGGAGSFGARRRVMAVLAACLGVFAMLGVGERSDVLAHLSGLGFGLLLGLLAGRFLKLPLSRTLRLTAGGLSAVAVAGAWWLAFSF